MPGGGGSRETISLSPSEGIVDLYSTNYFGMPYIHIFGEDQIGKIDWVIKEKVGEGVLFTFSPDPLLWADEKIRRAQERTKAFLNHGAFYGKITGFKPDLGLRANHTDDP